MKAFFIAFFLAALSGSVSAQPVSSDGQQDTIGAQRTAIGAERARLETEFLAEDAACYKKFAVNNCLNNVNARRREAMADLRRREILLSDEERRTKGAEQIRRIGEKSSAEKLPGSVDRNPKPKPNQDYQSRLDREKNKKQERSTARSDEKVVREGNAENLLGRQKKALERSRKQAAAAEEARKYTDRQNEALKRRAEHEAEKAKQAKPSARPLPVPDL